jgi:hypothetical protein
MDRVRSLKSNLLNSNIFNKLINIFNLHDLNKWSIPSNYLIFTSILIILIIYFVNNKTSLNKTNCTKLSEIYITNPPLNSIVDNTEMKSQPLRDFYIKTAYNCCCSGQFKNDYVNMCALNACISQGVRCLDFEIYSIDDKPVVAASSVDDYTVKETYNSLPLDDVFNTITQRAFSSGICSNFNDPIILHFRIMSNNVAMYDNFADIISNTDDFNSRTLGKEYSYEYHGNNLGAVPISNFKQKIIIIVDGTNPLYKSTALNEYVNITSGSVFMHFMRYKDIKYNQITDPTDFNKYNMTIVLPDINADNNNPNFELTRKYGCQFLGMSFQNNDTNLQEYNKFFDKNKTAFVYKLGGDPLTPLATL